MTASGIMGWVRGIPAIAKLVAYIGCAWTTELTSGRSLYTLMCILISDEGLKPGFAFLGELHWRLVSLGLMSFLAFGPEVKLGCCFTVLDLALEGAVMAADRGGLWQLPLYAAGVYLLGKFAFGTPGKRLLPVQISGCGETLRITALLDTGNQLRDPITGEAVLVIGCREAQRLTGLGVEQLKKPLQTMTSPPIPGLRLIPYHAVGSKGGFMLAMRFPGAVVGKKQQNVLVAFAAEGLERTGMYQALTGGAL